jgi:hypothetical protein
MANPQSKRKRTTRKSLCRELLWRKSIVLIGLLILFTSTGAFLWDELVAPLLPPGSERPKLIDVFLWLPWYGWVITGLLLLILFVGEQAYKLIHSAEENLELAENASRTGIDPVTGLPISRPVVMPDGYRHEHRRGHGLFVANDGYAGNTVSIPDVAIGQTMSRLSFTGTLTRLAPGEKQFFEASIKHPERPERGGSDLRQAMVLAQIDQLKFGIVYRDTGILWYRSNCIIKLTHGEPGLSVEFVNQELIDGLLS